jgi:hypothetical protein
VPLFRVQTPVSLFVIQNCVSWKAECSTHQQLISRSLRIVFTIFKGFAELVSVTHIYTNSSYTPSLSERYITHTMFTNHHPKVRCFNHNTYLQSRTVSSEYRLKNKLRILCDYKKGDTTCNHDCSELGVDRIQPCGCTKNTDGGTPNKFIYLFRCHSTLIASFKMER